jgi:predicted amino acid-binding ACT domain protein
MPDTVRKVHYYSTTVTDKPGQIFGVLAALVSGGVNLLACTSGNARGGRMHVDVVPEDTRKFAAAARKAGLLFSEKRAGFLIQGGDRTGALADNLKVLAEAGINVVSVDGLSAGSGRWGAILWVADKDIRRAGSLLRANAK